MLRVLSEIQPAKLLRETRILFPRALRGRESFVNELREREATVDVVPVYQTIETPEALGPLLEALNAGMLDAVVLTSPAILRSLCVALGGDFAQKLAPVTVLAIGKTTRTACEAEGIRVDAVPDDPSDAAIYVALERYYQALNERAPRG